ncbi:MAG: D-cysteine desulfhydrase family protein [Fimbriimonadaceae bacterium]
MNRIPLICAPTPVHRLNRLSAELNVDLWIKRDDLTGFALGGNKGRKLEYLLADAIDFGAQTLVTCGATQSNFVRQLGAACAVAKLRCVAVVMSLPYDAAPAAGGGLADAGGNVLLDELLGVERRILPDGTWDELYAEAELEAARLEAVGERVYRVPVGGSSPLGAYAFTKAAEEVDAQTDRFDWIVFASSSGSTQVGLTWHYRGVPTRVLGIACDPEPSIADDFVKLGEGLARMLGSKHTLARDAFELNFDYVGGGYGIPSDAGHAANVRLARTEGIFLDPIYTSKAFAGLLNLVGKGTLAGRILFWHTGGVPALFAGGHLV